MEYKITTLEDLAEIAKGEIVKLPPFTGGKEFVARVKRPSVLAMSSSSYGMPNELLEVAHTLFFDEEPLQKIKEYDPKEMENLNTFLNIIAKECLVSPTYEDIERAGLNLTDSQLLALFNYSQQGVNGLKPFCEQ